MWNACADARGRNALASVIVKKQDFATKLQTTASEMGLRSGVVKLYFLSIMFGVDSTCLLREPLLASTCQKHGCKQSHFALAQPQEEGGSPASPTPLRQIRVFYSQNLETSEKWYLQEKVL